MKINAVHFLKAVALVALALSIFNSQLSTAFAQGTAFTYQGRLNDGTNPANGSYNMLFGVYDDANVGNEVAYMPSINVFVTNGLFTVNLDFGSGVFTGASRWLSIDVRTNGASLYTLLSPRQQITPTPYAICASSLNYGLVVQQNTNGAPNMIGGSSANGVVFGVIGATIAGGGATNYAGGKSINDVTANFGTVSGGGQNSAGGIFSTVGGGEDNYAGAADSTVSGGFFNQAVFSSATVGGGQYNYASADGSTVGGGEENSATNGLATVSGGIENIAGGADSTIGGGGDNLANGNQATIGGGEANIANGSAATVPGGNSNAANGTTSFAAGYRAKANHDGSFVWADFTSADFNSTAADQFLIRASGGVGINTTNPIGKLSIYGNSTPGPHIPAGTTVLASGDGFNNRFMSVYGDEAVYLSMWTLGYGELSTYNYSNGTALPLILNSNGGNVGIGTTTPAAQLDVVTRSTNGAAISGSNSLGGVYGQLGVSAYLLPETTYCGVYGNGNVPSTLAHYGLNLAGYFDGTVLVNGNLGANSFQVSGISQLGGLVSIGAASNNGLTTQLDVEGYDDSGNFLTPLALIRNNDTGSAAAPALTVAGMGNTGNGVLCVTTGGTGLLARFGNVNAWVADIRNNGTIDAMAFNTTSDRNAKENFSPVSPRAVLEKVASLPISKWNFKKDGGTSHIGPMAQDFYSAFNVGSDDKHIATVDEDGVALAAIQGLNQKLNEKNAEVQDLKARLEKLEQLMNAKTGETK